jgi:hypothetical protein
MLCSVVVDVGHPATDMTHSKVQCTGVVSTIQSTGSDDGVLPHYSTVAFQPV